MSGPTTERVITIRVLLRGELATDEPRGRIAQYDVMMVGPADPSRWATGAAHVGDKEALLWVPGESAAVVAATLRHTKGVVDARIERAKP